jgi:hypothetical protein
VYVLRHEVRFSDTRAAIASRGRSGLSLYETEKSPSVAIARRPNSLSSNRLDTIGSSWLKAATKAEAEAWNGYMGTSNQMT